MIVQPRPKITLDTMLRALAWEYAAHACQNDAGHYVRHFVLAPVAEAALQLRIRIEMIFHGALDLTGA
jgi:hypothetical protein